MFFSKLFSKEKTDRKEKFIDDIMLGMAKDGNTLFFVDSENVGGTWVGLVDELKDFDKLIVFYTDKSAHLSCGNVKKLMENAMGKIEWVKCYEGNNALDFQLVSTLGDRLSKNEAQNYVIFSKDTGYDPVVRFWSEKGYNIKRFGNVGSMIMGEGDKPEKVKKSDMKKIQKYHIGEDGQKTKPQPQQPKQAQASKQAQAPKQAQASKQPQLQKQQPVQQPKPAQPKTEQSKPAQQPKTVPQPKPAPQPKTEQVQKMPVIKNEKAEQAEKAEKPENMLKPEAKQSAAKQPAAKQSAEKQPAGQTASGELEKFDGLDVVIAKELSKCIKLEQLEIYHEALFALKGEEEGNKIYYAVKSSKRNIKTLRENYVEDSKQRMLIYLGLLFEGKKDAQFVEKLCVYLQTSLDKTPEEIYKGMMSEFGTKVGQDNYKYIKKSLKVLRNI